MSEVIEVSAVVLRDGTGRVLVVRKRGTSAFMFPGGKPEPGEDAAAAAIRECAEEVGAVLDGGLLRSLGEFETAAANEPGVRVRATVFEHPADDVLGVLAPRGEIDEIAWVGLDDAHVAPLLRDAVFPTLQRASRVRRVTVFTGSSDGASPAYADGAAALGRALAGSGRDIVYGGGKVGLMGAVADAALAAGGEVYGVIPQSLVDAEVAHEGLTRLDVVPDMHARKLRMARLTDAFVALPGGIGTLEELFEVWTWLQLGLHAKPVALYDIDGYWQPLLSALDRMTDQGFLSRRSREGLIVVASPDELIAAVEGWIPPPSRWARG